MIGHIHHTTAMLPQESIHHQSHQNMIPISILESKITTTAQYIAPYVGCNELHLYTFSIHPTTFNPKAKTNAPSLSCSNRPGMPAWPASMMVLSNSKLSPCFFSRNVATHLAGSQ